MLSRATLTEQPDRRYPVHALDRIDRAFSRGVRRAVLLPSGKMSQTSIIAPDAF
jgi:hypothetical protein